MNVDASMKSLMILSLEWGSLLFLRLNHASCCRGKESNPFVFDTTLVGKALLKGVEEQLHLFTPARWSHLYKNTLTIETINKKIGRYYLIYTAKYYVPYAPLYLCVAVPEGRHGRGTGSKVSHDFAGRACGRLELMPHQWIKSSAITNSSLCENKDHHRCGYVERCGHDMAIYYIQILVHNTLPALMKRSSNETNMEELGVCTSLCGE
ncbi:hypothetical protein M433DRAFT_325774 [Acidomyces richmondensis BFW]|nr:MAG: hypothetical protein FE78DRAFT_326247 [Acidomyces sp. 'richmondensis']KYG43959.1 hypothetical protein M433DRAFT_325774 [Acidomyces richmondensis BFW]